MRIEIKPLSINECFQGKRFKTKKYIQYEAEMLYTLKPLKLPQSPYKVYYEFGFSSKLADVDNCVKPLQDILQKKYNFNDKDIIEMHVKKTLVKKGQEYLIFKIESYENKENTD